MSLQTGGVWVTARHHFPKGNKRGTKWTGGDRGERQQPDALLPTSIKSTKPRA